MDIELPAVRSHAESEAEDRPPSTVEYLDYRTIEENGWDLEDDDLFEKAAAADLEKSEYGVIEADRNESLLRTAEENDLKWPFQCRSGSCAMCTAVLKEGEAEMDVNLFLEDEEVEERGMRLTCTCRPRSDEVRIVCGAIRMEYVRDVAQNRG
ncbi:ferredoxin Fer [Halalkalicoccus ordinarius]|uniref:ferredoxin Fer n=1 Tax=Halalkalicoccus ordinarius TaxID=3116651 RepID=UPI00300F152E